MVELSKGGMFLKFHGFKTVGVNFLVVRFNR